MAIYTCLETPAMRACALSLWNSRVTMAIPARTIAAAITVVSIRPMNWTVTTEMPAPKAMMAGGACIGSSVNCDDGNLCTTDACDVATGCVATNNNLPCDDGDACSLEDTCSEGAWPGFRTLCDDGNVCTDDACVEACVFTPNSKVATMETHAPKVTSVWTADARVQVSTATTGTLHDGYLRWLRPMREYGQYPALHDGDGCTQGDACLDGACVGGVAQDCDDGNVCTDDACADGACATANDADRDDGNACTTTSACAAGVPG